jgi:hypothetical protein
MSFYIRKAFKAGPIRFNLSKSGLGLSGGITGARIGINSRGTYVHGGRHGLYYRKYSNQRNKIAKRGFNSDGKSNKVINSETVSIFRDTGLTYPVKNFVLRAGSQNEPTLPSSNLVSIPSQIGLTIAIILLIISLFAGMSWILILSIIFTIPYLLWLGWNRRWKYIAQRTLDEIVHITEKSNEFLINEIPLNENMPDRWRTWLNLHLHAVIAELAMRKEGLDTISTLRILDERTPANKEIVNTIRSSILGNLLDEMLEDHILSEDEELSILRLIKQINLPEQLISHELQRLTYYSHIRKEIERPLEMIHVDIPLVRGEKAFEVFNEARILSERVLNRFQRENISYREIGYEVESEGRLILTDRRILLIERGSREYRTNKLVDVTADPEAGIVELVFSNRKTPVFITVKEPLVLAARIEKVIEEIKST